MDISHSVLLLVDSLFSRCKVAVYCENRHRREDKERHNQLCNILPPQNSSKAALEPSQLEVPYKLVQIEGKGRGLVATRTLEVGELVLSERAFLKISFKSKITSFFRLIEFEPEIRAKLMNLSCPADSSLKDFDDNQILQRKFEANCIAMHTGVENDVSLVFEMISMINHSCMPNVVWFPEDADKERKEVRVCRRIQEGEEIVASYIELAQLPLRQQRREMLRPRGFFCRSIFFSLSPN